ncbi:MAG TPA: RDD family protein [Streptosporangiaceae bacterium]|nr:RDD family protein [Streptosporangiaceae bacterium]
MNNPQYPPYGRPSYGQQSYGPGQYADAAGDLPTAPFWRRAGARVTDSIIVWAFGFATIFPLVLAATGSGKNDSAWSTPVIVTMFVAGAVLPFVYEAIQLAVYGQTLGKRFLGLRVVQADPGGEHLTLAQAIWRAAINNIVYQLGIFFFLVIGVTVFVYALAGMLFAAIGVLLSYLWAIWDQPLHQAVHDRFAGTVVIDDRVEYE